LSLGFYYIQNFENYEIRSKTVYIFLDNFILYLMIYKYFC
jgi:hypothetical protein